MMLQLLKAKIQQLVVNESNINYPGSITLPQHVMESSGIKQFELVHVNNRTNGNRIITYVVKGKEKQFVSINGAASKLFNKGDVIHVLAFAYFQNEEAENHIPILVITDNENKVISKTNYTI
jgi:aspartate 1-decarboxylase